MENKIKRTPSSVPSRRGAAVHAAMLLLIVAVTMSGCRRGTKLAMTPTSVTEPAAANSPTATPPATATETAPASDGVEVTRVVVEVVEVTPPGGQGIAPPVPPGSESLNSDSTLSEAERIGESERFLFYRVNGSETLPLSGLEQKAEEIYDYLSQRLEIHGPEQIEVLFLPPDPSACPVRGQSGGVFIEDEQRVVWRVLVYAGQETGREQLYGVLAHEVAHAFNGESRLLAGERGLNEGFASWAAGVYQTTWYGAPSFDDLVRGYRADGHYLPLPEHPNFSDDLPNHEAATERCLERRDRLYTEWASFVGFLIERYGLDPFHALIESTLGERSGDFIISSPADYEGVYGLSLSELEEQWLTHLEETVTEESGR